MKAIRFALVGVLLLGCLFAQAGAAPSAKVTHRTASAAETAAATTTNEIWIAVRTDSVPGRGSANDPFDGSTQTKLDAVMAAIPPNRVIHLGAGTFLTQGIVPKSGWRLYLTARTILRLGVIPSIPGQKWAIFGAGSSTSVADVHIEGGTWDCNLQSQTIPMAAQAIAFIAGGGNVTIKNVRAINWGSTLAGAECFVVSVFNVGSTGQIARNITFDGIEVTQPAPIVHQGTSSLIGAQGQDPVDETTLSNGWIQRVEIKNCYVHDFDSPMMTASIQMGSWCEGVHIHHNRCENLGPKSNTLFGCYLDTGASKDVLVEKNVFAGVVHSIWASMSTTVPVERWIIRNNRIRINRNYLSGGIELYGGNTTIKDVLIEGNRISSETGKELIAYGILLEKVTDTIVRRNTIDDINGSTHVVFGKAVKRVQVSDNRKRDRTLIRRPIAAGD